METVPREYAGAASGMLSTSQRVGAVLGVAVLGAVLQVSLSASLVSGLERLPGMTPTAAQRIVASDQASPTGLVGGAPGLSAALAGSGLSASVRTGLEPRLAALARAAFTDAMSLALRVAAAVVGAAALLTLLVKPGAEGSSADEAGGAGPGT
jgi:hypothetical protein